MVPLSPQPKSPRTTRRGTVILAMVALIVISATLAAIVTTLAIGRKHRQTAIQSVQAAFLAESGLRKGVQARVRDAKYAGETRLIPASDLDGIHAGRIVITVTPAPPPASDQVLITARGEFPASANPDDRAAVGSVHTLKRIAPTQNTSPKQP